MMTAPRILDLVTSCKGCPNREYESAGMHGCKLANELILDDSIIAPFCPLPVYPSRTIAGQQRTILSLRATEQPHYLIGLLGHIATKLNLNLEPDGRGVVIPFKDHAESREVYLAYDHIMAIELPYFKIKFISGDKYFRLSPDTKPPILEEQSEKVPGLEQHDLWQSHRL